MSTEVPIINVSEEVPVVSEDESDDGVFQEEAPLFIPKRKTVQELEKCHNNYGGKLYKLFSRFCTYHSGKSLLDFTQEFWELSDYEKSCVLLKMCGHGYNYPHRKVAFMTIYYTIKFAKAVGHDKLLTVVRGKLAEFDEKYGSLSEEMIDDMGKKEMCKFCDNIKKSLDPSPEPDADV